MGYGNETKGRKIKHNKESSMEEVWSTVGSAQCNIEAKLIILKQFLLKVQK